MAASRVADILPQLAAELAAGLRGAGEDALAGQVASLRLVARSGCGDAFCASFHTAPPPRGAYGEGHRNVEVPVPKGVVILDVVQDRVVFVEVLDRGDVRALLRDAAR
jgi:hypothetical protein